MVKADFDTELLFNDAYEEFEIAVEGGFRLVCKNLQLKEGIQVISKNLERGLSYFMILVRDGNVVGMVRIDPASREDKLALFSEEVETYTLTVFVNQSFRGSSYLDYFLNVAIKYISDFNTDGPTYIIDKVLVPNTKKHGHKRAHVVQALLTRGYEERIGENDQGYFIKQIK